MEFGLKVLRTLKNWGSNRKTILEMSVCSVTFFFFLSTSVSLAISLKTEQLLLDLLLLQYCDMI